MDTNLRLEFKTSLTNTPVASHGPLFVTLIVNSIRSDTLTTDETLTTLVISKSTMFKAIILVILATLFEVLVSFSIPLTTTTLEILPSETTRASITKTALDWLVKLPITQLEPS